MFAAVRFDTQRRGAFRRLGDRVRARGTTARLRDSPGDGCWEIVQRTYGGPPRWGELAELCGPLGSRLLLPRGVGPPEGCGLRALPLEDFYARLAAECAARLLEALQSAGREASVGLYDPDGRCCRLAGTLAPCCGAVVALTARPDRYRTCAARLMADTGASLTFAAETDALRGCAVCVAPSPVGDARLPCPVLAADGSPARGRPTANALRALLPADAAEALPEGADPTDFLGALVLYGAYRPGPLAVESLRIDGRLAAPEELQSIISSKCRNF